MNKKKKKNKNEKNIYINRTNIRLWFPETFFLDTM